MTTDAEAVHLDTVVVVSEHGRLSASLVDHLRPRAVHLVDRVDAVGVASLTSHPRVPAAGLVLVALGDEPGGAPHGPEHLQGFVDATLPDLSSRPDGRIVVVTSAGGATGEGTHPDDAAAAGAVVGWARSLVRRLGPSGLTVNVVATPATDAPAGEPAPGALLPWTVGEDDVAACVAFLLGPDAGFMTGAVLPADAGASIGIY